MLLSNYSYVYDVTKLAIHQIKKPTVLLAKPFDIVNIELIGSRMSAKTLQMLKWLVELGYQDQVKVATDIWRNEVSGANETYDELIGVLEDIYDIEANLKNSNSTKRRLRLPNNTINVNGFLSNRKNKTPKLGKARKGVKKDIQVNLFEEATEFGGEQQIQMIQQATGGAKIIINIFIANPWVLSNWYVKGVNKFLPFNEKKLRKHGEQLKQHYYKKQKTLRIAHITNHRINTYLHAAQHQMLFDSWNISEQFARVVDLGMPGVAEGLIYAPMLHKVIMPTKTMPTQQFKAGLDLGFSTGTNASATSLIIGRIGKNYAQIAIDDEYYHSNAKQHFKSQDEICSEVIEKLMDFVIKNREAIHNSDSGVLTLSYDFAAFGWGSMLQTELNKYHKTQRVIAEMIEIVPSVKFRVPTRINIITALMSQGRYKVNRDTATWHWEELENSLWDESKEVKGLPTRLNKDDHTLDAMEYMIGSDLVEFMDTNYFTLHKHLDTAKMTSTFS